MPLKNHPAPPKSRRLEPSILLVTVIGVLVTVIGVSFQIATWAAERNGGPELWPRILLVRGDGPPQLVSDDIDFHSGDRFRIRLTCSSAGFVYLLSSKCSDDTRLVYPSRRADHRVGSGEERTLPENGWLVFDEEPGIEELRVVFSTRPIDWLEESIEGYRGPLPLRIPRSRRLKDLLAGDVWGWGHLPWERRVVVRIELRHVHPGREWLVPSHPIPLGAPVRAHRLERASRLAQLGFELHGEDPVSGTAAGARLRSPDPRRHRRPPAAATVARMTVPRARAGRDRSWWDYGEFPG